MVQRDPSPRGDKNGADINLALDALELAFTHDHINAYAIISGDSDFIALVNKLKQYDKTVFVVGGKAFTSTILQKNCHEFVSYESMLDDGRSSRSQQSSQQHPPPEQHLQQERNFPQPQQTPRQSGETRQQRGQRRPPPLDLHQAMPLVERALQVLERREVRPQLGLLKSTMLQLDSTFSERAYGAGSFTDFIEKLRKSDLIHVTGAEGRYMIQRKRNGVSEKTVRPEEALPVLRDVLENHRLEFEDGVNADDLAAWVHEEAPEFDWKNYGFQQFGEFLNYAQDKTVVRVVPDDAGENLIVHLGAEFHPPAIAEQEPPPPPPEHEGEDEKQPIVPGQPTAGSPRVKRGMKKAAAGVDVNGNVVAPARRPRKSAAPRKRRAPVPEV